MKNLYLHKYPHSIIILSSNSSSFLVHKGIVKILKERAKKDIRFTFVL